MSGEVQKFWVERCHLGTSATRKVAAPGWGCWQAAQVGRQSDAASLCRPAGPWNSLFKGHHYVPDNGAGRIALVGVETAEYAQFVSGRNPRSRGEPVKVTKAMRSSRARR